MHAFVAFAHPMVRAAHARLIGPSIARATIASTSGGALAFAALHDDADSSAARFGRTFWHASVVGYEYKYGAATKLPAGSAERKAALAETHQRSAERMLHVCRKHGGLYTKLGQFVASLNHILPPQYPLTPTVPCKSWFARAAMYGARKALVRRRAKSQTTMTTDGDARRRSARSSGRRANIQDSAKLNRDTRRACRSVAAARAPASLAAPADGARVEVQKPNVTSLGAAG